MTFKCRHCEATFPDGATRRKHIRKVHGNRLARTCCGQTFKTLREKKSHEVLNHNETLEIPLDTTIVSEKSSDKATQANASNCQASITAPDGKRIILYNSCWHPFGNFHTAPFSVDGTCHRTVEHFYQSEKARYFKDFNQQQRILSAWSPLAAKRLGGLIESYDPDRWNDVAYQVMVHGVREKVRQNKDIEEMLVMTGDALIAEASPYDFYWGIGKDHHAPDVHDYTKWRGFNAMGAILMKLRDELINEN